MPNYIITAQPREQFNFKGESLGLCEKLAVFYSPQIGRKRFYRQSFSNPEKGMKLLAFKTEKGANEVCHVANEVSGGGFKVELAQ